MFDSSPRGAVPRDTFQLRPPGPVTLGSRLRRLFSQAAAQANAVSSPFRVGDYLAGDDPFNGCKEGVVAVIRGPSIGLRTTSPRDGTVVYYDYRQLRKPW
ncbi:hypothetical protein [Arthrobacter sp. NA-172]|uniref:hypothetical protein n=1 Tax=Arthrobacter sp. NA-172 TaxID=3367524 RepID=UPI0037544195